VFPRVKDTVGGARDSRRLALDILDNAKVALVPGVAFGPSGEAHLRLNFGRERSDIDTAFERLEGYFRYRSLAQVQRGPVAQATAPTGTPLIATSRHHVRRLAVPYLQALARIFLRRKKPLVIAIAGSRGKTVIKRVLGELLAARYRVRTNPRSYNTEIGLPLAVLDLELETQRPLKVLWTLVRAAWIALCSTEQPEILVLELGVRQPGDMQQLLRTVHPDIAVLTNLTPSYSTDLEFLRTLQEEIRVLCRELGPRCHFLVDGDDPLLREAVQTLLAPPVFLHRSQWSPNNQGLLLQSNGHTYHVSRELVGESERVSVQAAVALAERWTKLTEADINRFLAGEERKAHYEAPDLR
jgi:UDP-N-acetylmuramyl pentapeptide synthase